MEARFASTLTDGGDDLQATIDAIERFLDENGVPTEIAAKLSLVFDEVISNARTHGGEDRAPAIDLAITVGNGTVWAEVTDDGKPFDPLAAPAPDTTLSVRDRPIGGLGVLLVRKLMDDVRYSRQKGRNRLRFSKDFPIAPGTGS
jgi:serine/threonine-protein kinase RsbW